MPALHTLSPSQSGLGLIMYCKLDTFLGKVDSLTHHSQWNSRRLGYSVENLISQPYITRTGKHLISIERKLKLGEGLNPIRE